MSTKRKAARTTVLAPSGWPMTSITGTFSKSVRPSTRIEGRSSARMVDSAGTMKTNRVLVPSVGMPSLPGPSKHSWPSCASSTHGSASSGWK